MEIGRHRPRAVPDRRRLGAALPLGPGALALLVAWELRTASLPSADAAADLRAEAAALLEQRLNPVALRNTRFLLARAWETVAARCCSESADELDVDAAAGAEAEQGVHDAAAVGLGVVLADDEDSYHNPSIANLVRFVGGGSRAGACRILVARRSCLVAAVSAACVARVEAGVGSLELLDHP